MTFWQTDGAMAVGVTVIGMEGDGVMAMAAGDIGVAGTAMAGIMVAVEAMTVVTGGNDC